MQTALEVCGVVTELGKQSGAAARGAQQPDVGDVCCSELTQIASVTRKVMAHHDGCIESRQIQFFCEKIGRPAKHLFGTCKITALYMRIAMIDDRTSPAHFCRQADNGFRVHPGTQDQQSRRRLDEREQHRRGCTIEVCAHKSRLSCCVLLKKALGRLRAHAVSPHVVLYAQGCCTRAGRARIGINDDCEPPLRAALHHAGDIGKRLVRVVLAERLQENSHQTVAADTKPPKLVVLREIVRDNLWNTGIDDGGSTQDEVALETTAGKHSLETTVARNQHLGARLAVGRSLRFVDSHEYEWLSSLSVRLEKPRKSRRIHVITAVE